MATVSGVCRIQGLRLLVMAYFTNSNEPSLLVPFQDSLSITAVELGRHLVGLAVLIEIS